MSPRNQERLDAKLIALKWLAEETGAMQVISPSSQASITGGDAPPLLIEQSMEPTAAAPTLTFGDPPPING